MPTLDVGADTLGVLTQQTSTAGDELAAQVRALAVAADPLEGRFNGEGRAAFDQFKADSDEIAVALSAALTSVLEGIAGQDRAWTEGEQQWVSEQRSAHAGAGFEFARFGAR